MAHVNSTGHSNSIRVSTIHRSKRIHKAKHFKTPSTIHVTKTLKSHSFSKKSKGLKQKSVDHVHRVNSDKRHSPTRNEIQPLPNETFANTKYEMDMQKSATKTSHQETQEQMRNNSRTITDLDRQLPGKSPSNKYRIEEKIENETKISSNHCNGSFGSINQMLFEVSPSYQSSRLFTNRKNKKNTWIQPIEPISRRKSHLPRRTDKKKRKYQRFMKYFGRCCSPCCILISLVGALLLAAGLAALLIALLNKNKNTTITTATTTRSTITTVTTTSTTTVTTTTQTSTTTTALNCSQSCLNQSWSDPSGVLALWPFDGSYNDNTTIYNEYTSANLPTFVTGYLGQAASFNASAKQTMYTPFIPLNNASFSIEAWIQPTAYLNPTDHSLLGMCQSASTDYCLQLIIRNQKLYFGFHGDDIAGGTTLPLNQWMHVAFVFDATTRKQTIYLNGFLDGSRTTNGVLLAKGRNVTIGTNEMIGAPNNFFQGYMDQLEINQRAKSSCEILERATLAAYFKFDTSSSYIDSGPNRVITTSSTTSIVTGYKNQAISFTGSSSSYFQTWGFTSIGISNQAFSISFWIQPQTLSGTLIHLSTSSSGTGSTCFPLLGFASNGAIVAQVLNTNNTIVTATGPILLVSLSWIPIVQTWSSTNGLRLFVNNTLVSSVAAPDFLGSEITPNYLTLGNCLSGCGVCSNGLVGAPGPFTGAIDDWRVYSRELSISDVCALFYAF